MNNIGSSSLRDLAKLRDAKRKRISSWDRMGGNWDFLIIPAGQTATVADITGAGCVTHIWVTMLSVEGMPDMLRKVVIRMYWDGEANPSVEAPIGDFFGMGHAMHRNFVSLPLAMLPQEGKGFNCFFPMPFANGAKITIENQGEVGISHFFYYVDYEGYASLEDGLGRFHATWNRENGTTPDPQIKHSHGTPNLTGKGNYVILEAEGKGHYVGCNLNIDSPRSGWYGEGDDMIFIDGDELPTLTGTGTEDYFNTAFCPNQEYSSPYSGLIYQENPDWIGKTSLYRYHIEDPIMFDRSIKVTIEHGHANDLENDYSSTAYWYQTEPHKPHRALPPVSERLPGKAEV